MGLEVLTLGFARRVATYKRADLVFRDLDRLRAIARRAGRLQIIFAGKAHRPSTGKARDRGRINPLARTKPGGDGHSFRTREGPDARHGNLVTPGQSLWILPRNPLREDGQPKPNGAAAERSPVEP